MVKYFPASSYCCELTWPTIPEDIRYVGSFVKFNQSIFFAGRYIASDFKCYKLDFMEVGSVWKEVNLPKNVIFPHFVVQNDTLYMTSLWLYDAFYRYEDGQWIRLSKVPSVECQLTACGDYIYAHMRGDDVGFYRYDPLLDHWQRLQAMDKNCHSLFTWKGYVCAQYHQYKRVDDGIYRYDVPSNSWEKITDAPLLRRCFEWNDDIVACSLYNDDEDVRKGLYTYDGFKWTKYFDYKDVENISACSCMSIDI